MHCAGAANHRLSAVTSALDSQVVARAAEVAALRHHCAQLRAAAGQSPAPLPAARPPASTVPVAALVPAGHPPTSQPPTCQPLTGQPLEILVPGQSMSGVITTEHAGAAVHGADAPGVVVLEGSSLVSVVAHAPQQHGIPQPVTSSAVIASQVLILSNRNRLGPIYMASSSMTLIIVSHVQLQVIYCK